MWIQFDEKQLEALGALVALGQSKTVGTILNGFAEVVAERMAWYAAPDANDQRYRDAVETNDELEMDADAVTSIGDEGAFVMTWTFVRNEDAGVSDEPEDDPDYDDDGNIRPGVDHALFEEPKPMAERGSSILKSSRGEGYNYID